MFKKSQKLVVTRHSGLVQVLREDGLIGPDTKVVEHADPFDIKGKDVIGVLPLWLAAYASSVTEIPMNIPPDLRGQELDAETTRKYAGKPHTYKVSRQWKITYNTEPMNYDGPWATFTEFYGTWDQAERLARNKAANNRFGLYGGVEGRGGIGYAAMIWDEQIGICAGFAWDIAGSMVGIDPEDHKDGESDTVKTWSFWGRFDGKDCATDWERLQGPTESGTEIEALSLAMVLGTARGCCQACAYSNAGKPPYMCSDVAPVVTLKSLPRRK